MIVFTRDLARGFRAVARKCVREWRKRAPPVVEVVVRGGTLTLSADLGDAALSVSAPTRGRPDAAVAFPLLHVSYLPRGNGDVTHRVARLTPCLSGEVPHESWTEGKRCRL